MSTCILFSQTELSHSVTEQPEFLHQCGKLRYHSTIECVYKMNIGLHCCVGITICLAEVSVLGVLFELRVLKSRIS